MDRLNHRRTIARDLLRELLAETRREQERAHATGERLRALVRAGRHAGLGPAELAEASGLSRPGIYEVQRRSSQGPVDGLDEIVLAALGAEGATTAHALASVLGVSEQAVGEAIARLAAAGTVALATAGYGGTTATEIVRLSSAGEELLEEQMGHVLSRRPEQWTAYLSVAPAEQDALFEAAEQRFGSNSTALLSTNVRRDMGSPEIAITFDVADVVGLVNAAAAAWHDLRESLGLPQQPVRIAAYVPPSVRSEVLEAFGRGMLDRLDPDEREVTRLLADARPTVDEHDICVRALTEAAWALRRAVGESARPPELSTGDAAFEELSAVVSIVLDEQLAGARKALVDALDLAIERLGPFPGGRLGHFRAPGHSPHVVEAITPTHRDLVSIARSSGEAVGCIAAAMRSPAIARDAVTGVVSGASATR